MRAGLNRTTIGATEVADKAPLRTMTSSKVSTLTSTPSDYNPLKARIYAVDILLTSADRGHSTTMRCE